ncbi:SMP-30/gluconolactonase/LRE family protein [Paenibacillus thermotolerans]|uniref:SMP-30/gluconolactonase/LRE family protein n=1 Tax=Paenibacillus thermotolerans TaxID=3027807 RepID=UPI0023676CE8|nr:MULTISPECIES: SMP-30/gluconolactonase/LRE family protein [unclassified Paenibacillus]
MESLSFRSIEFTKRDSFTRGIEGPACDAQGNVYAVAFKHETPRAIGRVNERGEASLFAVLPEGSIGCGMRIHPKRGLIYAADFAGHNVLQIELSTGEIAVLAYEPRMNQPNDLAITSQGVLFASDPNWDASTGQLWRIDPDGGIKLLESGMGTTNGIEVSPDERTLYVNETMERRIWAYDLSGDCEVGNKRLFYRFEDHLLDGMRCDAAGNLYVTRYGKGCIAVISPSGELLTEVGLHGKNCTNLTFGGADGRDCYVTVGDHGNIERFRTDIPGRCWTMWR